MGSATLPAGYAWCDECSRTGREIVTDELLDDDGEVLAEIPRDYGPCEICEGRGWLALAPAEAERAAQRASLRKAMDEHLNRGVHGSAHCPPGCPVELDLYKEHRRPGGVHETRCTPDHCIGY